MSILSPLHFFNYINIITYMKLVINLTACI